MKMTLTLFAAGVAVTAAAATRPLEFGPELFKLPETTPATVRFALPSGVKAVFMTGPAYQGKPTRIFACYGVPNVPAGTKVPGVILLHGSGGTAFAKWVALWNSRGYAAIAVDYHGRMPYGPGWDANTANAKLEGGGPGEDRRWIMSVPDTDTFTYQAVSAVLLAHSVLAAQPGVDADNIGVIGVSMGAVLAARIAGIDPRTSFAVMVYGCGDLLRGSVFGDRARHNYKMTDADLDAYVASHDPVVYLPKAKCPLLFVNHTNDPFFRTKPWMSTIAAARSEVYQSMRRNFKHSHVDSDVPEILYFVNWRAGKLPAIPRISKPVEQGGKLSAQIASASSDQWTAELIWTAEPGYGNSRKWQSSPAGFNASGDQLQAELPAGCRSAFFRISRKDGVGFSSPIVLF